MSKSVKKESSKKRVIKFKMPERIKVTQEELDNNPDLISEDEMSKKTNRIFEVQKMTADIRDYSLRRVFSSKESILEVTRISNDVINLLLPLYLKVGIETDVEISHCKNSTIRAIRSIMSSHLERLIEDSFIERGVFEEKKSGVSISNRVLNTDAILPININKEAKEVASNLVLRGFAIIRMIQDDMPNIMCESLDLLSIEFNKKSKKYKKIKFIKKELLERGYQHALEVEIILGED